MSALGSGRACPTAVIACCPSRLVAGGGGTCSGWGRGEGILHFKIGRNVSAMSLRTTWRRTKKKKTPGKSPTLCHFGPQPPVRPPMYYVSRSNLQPCGRSCWQPGSCAATGIGIDEGVGSDPLNLSCLLVTKSVGCLRPNERLHLTRKGLATHRVLPPLQYAPFPGRSAVSQDAAWCPRHSFGKWDVIFHTPSAANPSTPVQLNP